MEGGHLDAGPGRPHTVRIQCRELIHVHLVIGEQDVALEIFRLGSRVVLQALDGKIHALGAEQKELLSGDIQVRLVDLLEQLGRREINSRARGFNLDLRPEPEELRKLPSQVPPVGSRPGSLSPDHRVVL